jgi:hypothetical protein
VEFTAISWNLFHGRDFPPDPALFTWRSRLLRVTEHNATHLQVNRDLLAEFAHLLARAEWDVALLQECPPRWCAPLARACDAEAHLVLTARNSLGPLRALAARLNPDLVASAEGGSNLTLIRGRSAQLPSAVSYPSYRGITHSGTLGEILERRELAIHEGTNLFRNLACAAGERRTKRGKDAGRPNSSAIWPTEDAAPRSVRRRQARAGGFGMGSQPERRAMALTRIGGGTGPELCVANLHATNDRPDLATEDVLRAAGAATAWAGDAPLLFGGDFNLRPAETPAVFAELEKRFGPAVPTGPNAIDHLLVRGLDIVELPHQWPPERRELGEDGRALRLSDHAPVEARFSTRAPR